MGSEKKHVVAHMIDKTLIAESEEFAEAGWGTDAKCSEEVKVGSGGPYTTRSVWLIGFYGFKDDAQNNGEEVEGTVGTCIVLNHNMQQI